MCVCDNLYSIEYIFLFSIHLHVCIFACVHRHLEDRYLGCIYFYSGSKKKKIEKEAKTSAFCLNCFVQKRSSQIHTPTHIHTLTHNRKDTDKVAFVHHAHD